jgi:hypothetical protein
MGFITGKSTQKSESKNLAYPYLQNAYGGQVSAGTGANDLVSRLLTGGQGAGQAFDTYKNSTGYQNVLDGGSRAITGNAASRGLLSSGSTLKALNNYGQDTAKSYFNKYLQQLLGLSGQGLQAGGLIGNAGQVSSQQSKSKPGLAPLLGTGLSMIPGM